MGCHAIHINETPFLHLMELEIENTLCTRVSEKMRQHPTVEAGHCVWERKEEAPSLFSLALSLRLRDVRLPGLYIVRFV